MPRALSTRWSLWLPLAAALVAAGLIALGVLAAAALGENRDLARTGEALRLAHAVERGLRDAGPEAAPRILGQALRETAGSVKSLTLLSPAGGVEVEVGEAAAAVTYDVELFLGRAWVAGGPPGGEAWIPGAGGFMRGRRILRLGLEPVRPKAIERAVVPAAVTVGTVLVALAILGGSLLERQRETAMREATRRRLEGLGRAGAGLAHQLRTPLATVKGTTQLLLEEAAPGTADRLGAILEQSERMERLIGHLLDYARPPRAEPACIDLGAALAPLAGRDPRLRLDVPEELTVRADPEHFGQMMDNLVDNALASGPAGTPVEVTARARDSRVEIEVLDRGPGPGDDPEHLFEPYVTGRASGTGLGLPIARALAEANGGSVVLRSRPGGGAGALLILPRWEAAA